MKLKEFQERDLKGERYVSLFLDGKSFADTTLVIALGVTVDGTKLRSGISAGYVLLRAPVRR